MHTYWALSCGFKTGHLRGLIAMGQHGLSLATVRLPVVALLSDLEIKAAAYMTGACPAGAVSLVQACNPQAVYIDLNVTMTFFSPATAASLTD